MQLSANVFLDGVDQLILVEEVELVMCLLALVALLLLVGVRRVTFVVGLATVILTTSFHTVLVLRVLRVFGV